MQQIADWPKTLDLGRCCRVYSLLDDELTSLARQIADRRAERPAAVIVGTHRADRIRRCWSPAHRALTRTSFTPEIALIFRRRGGPRRHAGGGGRCAIPVRRIFGRRGSPRRGAELIDIGPQVFDLLVYLIHNRDRVVSKDDLLDAVWEGRIVSESTLTSRINAVRHAIGDTGADQTLIKTIARKGFRFIGEVEEGKKALPQASAGGAEGAAVGLRQEIHFCTASDGMRIAYAAVGQGASAGEGRELAQSSGI